MNRFFAVGIGVLLLLILLLFSMTYTVSFHEIAIKTTFGRSSDEAVITDPGLKFKWPIFADRVTTYDTRLQLLESPLEEKPTLDGQSVVVRAFLMWKIDVENARGFHDNYNTVDDARPFLQDQFREALSAVSQFRFEDLIGGQSRLVEAEQAVLARLDGLRSQGIEPVTVGISQLMLPSKATRAVLERMEVSRNTLATAERVKGEATAEKIKDNARTTADKIKAFADQVAGEIRAESNQRKREYYEQMSDPLARELALFLVWVDALEMSLSDNTTLILEDSIAPFHILNRNAATSANGVPLPESSLGGASADSSGDAGRSLAERDD